MQQKEEEEDHHQVAVVIKEEDELEEGEVVEEVSDSASVVYNMEVGEDEFVEENYSTGYENDSAGYEIEVGEEEVVVESKPIMDHEFDDDDFEQFVNDVVEEDYSESPEVEPQSPEIDPQSPEPEFQSLEMQPQSPEPELQSLEMQPQSPEIEVEIDPMNYGVGGLELIVTTEETEVNDIIITTDFHDIKEEAIPELQQYEEQPEDETDTNLKKKRAAVKRLRNGTAKRYLFSEIFFLSF